MAVAPQATGVTFGGSVNKVLKCFWCGAENDRHQDTCCVCKRKMQWTTFFKGVLRPSVGSLAGARTIAEKQDTYAALRLAS